jgi:hypothetical protein
MRVIHLLLSFMLSLLTPNVVAVPPRQAPQLDQVVISAPLPGQALQGDIVITGNTSVEGFVASQISFAYSGDATDTWFLIQYSTVPVDNDLLAHWDTTTITDGDYTLRLVIDTADGSQITLIVPGLRVRNYTPVETDTPTPLPASPTAGPGTPLPPRATPSAMPIPSATPPPPTPTPLPTNPAIISEKDVIFTVAEGAGIGTGLLALFGVILGIRHWLHNRR